MPFRRFVILTFLIIALLVTCIYSNSFRVPFQFDDVKRIVDIKAAQVLDPGEIFRYSKSRFFLYLTFALNYHFGRYSIFGYHFINLVVHIISSCLVFLLCLLIYESPRLSKFYFKKERYLLSLFASLIFAVHPLQTESVTYIWQRGESMAGLFYFLSIVLYAGFRQRQVNNIYRKGNIFLYLFCLLSIVLCSLTKPTSATLPVAIIFYEACFVSKDAKEFKDSLKYLILIAIFIFLPVMLAKFDTLESKNVGVRFTAPYMPYYYTKLRVLAQAFRLMIFPFGQRIEYDYVMSTSIFQPISTFYSLLLHLLFIAGAIVGFRRYPHISYFILWFYLTLSITSILFLDDLFFEHYLYLPLLSYAFLLPLSVMAFIHKFRINKKVFKILFVILLSIYSLAAYNRNKVWRTEISLWEDAVHKSPHKARPHYILGVYYFRAKRLEEALQQYRLALKYKSDYPEAYYRLGEYYFFLGDKERSIANYIKAIQLNQDFFEAYLNLGVIYLERGKFKNARVCLKKALTLTDKEYYKEKIHYMLRQIPEL